MNDVTLLIPKGFIRIAETFDQYKKVTVTDLYNPKTGRHMLKIVDHNRDNGSEIMTLPLKLEELTVLHNVLSDILSMRGNYKEI